MTNEQPSGETVSLKLPREQLRDLLEFDEGLRRARGIGILTPEGRVLMHIALEGKPPVSDAMAVAGTSYRGFYMVLRRLKEASLVQATVDENDQRVRRLSIDEGIRNDIGQ